MDTKNIIAEAMRQLMITFPFEKITTEMILNKAQVSRSTFYRYFDNKYTLMNWSYKSYIEKLLRKKPYRSWGNYMLEIYTFLYDNRGYFIRAFHTEGINSFWNFLYDFSYQYSVDRFMRANKLMKLPDEDRVAIEFFCIGEVHIAKQWLNEGTKVPVKNMAEWGYLLTPEKYRRCLDP